MRNKSLAGLVVGFFIGVFGWTASATAHVQTADNGVSAVMHILPEDSPRAAEDTFIQFAFGGSEAAFDVGTCGCELEVRDAAGISSIAPIEPLDASGTTSQIKVVFPRAGVYDLTLRGTAGQGQATQRHFAIAYVVRVSSSKEAGNKAGGVDIILVSLASLVSIGVIAYYTISSGARYATTSEAVKPTKKE